MVEVQPRNPPPAHGQYRKTEWGGESALIYLPCLSSLPISWQLPWNLLFSTTMNADPFFTSEQVAKGSRWDVKTLNTRDGASDLLKATVEMSSATWILSPFIKSWEFSCLALQAQRRLKESRGGQCCGVTVWGFVPWIADAVQREVDFVECFRNVGLGEPAKPAALGKALAELVWAQNGRNQLSLWEFHCNALRLSLYCLSKSSHKNMVPVYYLIWALWYDSEEDQTGQTWQITWQLKLLLKMKAWIY